MPTLAIHYNFGLVFVSVLMSMCASYAAISLSDRVRSAATARLRQLWLMSGAIAMGIGIWSMHYLGMLAVRLPVPVYYYCPTVVVSLLLAIAAARVALAVVSGEGLSARRLLLGGLLMAAGIGAMHYTGMAAMRSSAMERYNLWIVALSIAVAALFSWIALWVAFVSARRHGHSTWIRIGASAIMGMGISSMHYVAMSAAHFTQCATPFSTHYAVMVNVIGQWMIATLTGLVLLVALAMSALDRRRFTDLQKANEALIAAQAALIEIQQQLREANAMLSELSVRDGLTGLFNRRHFDAALETELRRAARNLKPISLLMIDVDFFKALNDGYGHQRGDDCLREIARVMQEQPRRGYDVAARYGGEEFVLLLPDAGYDAAVAIAEMIRKAVVALGIENCGSAAAGVVTVSIGVCCRHPHAENDNEGFVREADMALYAAKHNGRNQVQRAAQPVT